MTPSANAPSRRLLLVVLFALAACAGAPSSTAPSDVSLLTAAGFKTIAATSAPQLQRLPTLPQGTVTAVTQTGRTWFVYPDPANQRLFVGTQAQYDAYMRLRAQNGLASPDPYASSLAQDAAMTAKSARYANVPQWELDEFPELGNLGR